jgi:1-acyl-sn-glycerol-3-phosphate acyltransferase
MEALGPLIPDESTRASRARRRLLGISAEVLLLVALTALSPVLFAAGAVVDMFMWARRRKPWMAVRLLAMLWWFLVGEVFALAGLAVIWLRSRGRDSRLRRERVFSIKRSWLSSHLRGIRTLFAMRFEVEGLELAGPGPVLVMIRHASIIDNALPDVILGGAHGLGFRFVIKRELQRLPTIDIGGRWVPTLFVRRASGDTARELDRLRQLTVNLGSDEGLLIYPEGTRATPEKVARAKAIIGERQPELLALAEPLQHLLPPRLGGTLALLESARGADVVIFGHVGLDGFQYISDIWSGGLVGATVKMRFWRFPAAEIPVEREELIRWLYGCWQMLDDWVGQARAGGAAEVPPALGSTPAPA